MRSATKSDPNDDVACEWTTIQGWIGEGVVRHIAQQRETELVFPPSIFSHHDCLFRDEWGERYVQVKTYEGPVYHRLTDTWRHGLRHTYEDQVVYIVDCGVGYDGRRGVPSPHGACVWELFPTAPRERGSSGAPYPWFVEVDDMSKWAELPALVVHAILSAKHGGNGAGCRPGCEP